VFKDVYTCALNNGVYSTQFFKSIIFFLAFALGVAIFILSFLEISPLPLPILLQLPQLVLQLAQHASQAT